MLRIAGINVFFSATVLFILNAFYPGAFSPFTHFFKGFNFMASILLAAAFMGAGIGLVIEMFLSWKNTKQQITKPPEAKNLQK
ncbi:MAG: hypothetical protein COU46_02640 [Candidatus Niyogibacteria bacterium CG10_big_fil_rev_8_21_14_0_10_42_19]|uniref:Uncharacterized protein n=1 Tax=Candidatus Niyogibacteria bacterium CG10_big_fil_rev_8_21_14_0_10_42_19 TaxID=1974725 RepID=A0A2H0TF78_9BACT|nr:MAG: hypothetical protein COU46_02640 [Candidatus Niyogibacteria bacterium CG10_big_fil_rev_8_21_14_0_10_42_19]